VRNVIDVAANLAEEVNGSIIVYCDIDKNHKRNYRFEWSGGDVISMTYVLLEEADPDVLKVQGEFIALGPYKLKIIKRLDDVGIVLARRVVGVETAVSGTLI
jgi:hypothetical protein